MKLKSRHKSLVDPIMAAAAGADREEAWILAMNVASMSNFISRFECAVRLADHAEQLRRVALDERWAILDDPNLSPMERESALTPIQIYGCWIAMAARDAAMVIHDFDHLQKSIKTKANVLPSIASRVRRDRFKAAGKLFREYFPDAEQMRNAVAHDAERALTATAIEEYGFVRPPRGRRAKLATESGTTITRLVARTLHMSWKQRVISITVDEAALDQLLKIQTEIIEAFAPLSNRDDPLVDVSSCGHE